MVASITQLLHRTVQTTDQTDIQLWMLVLGAMLADIVVTIVGLTIGLIELNPIAVFGIETVGYSVLAFLKVPAVIIGFIGWITLPRHARRLNLVGLALPWIGAVIVNCWLILTTI